jgi:hypothetical protein
MIASRSNGVNDNPDPVDPRSEEAVVAAAIGAIPQLGVEEWAELPRPVARLATAAVAISRAINALQFLQAHSDAFWAARGPFEDEAEAEAEFRRGLEEKSRQTAAMAKALTERLHSSLEALNFAICEAGEN